MSVHLSPIAYVSWLRKANAMLRAVADSRCGLGDEARASPTEYHLRTTLRIARTHRLHWEDQERNGRHPLVTLVFCSAWKDIQEPKMRRISKGRRKAGLT